MISKILAPVVLLTIDRILKSLSVMHDGFFIFQTGFGVEFGSVDNPGVALSIPLPLFISVPFTLLLLGYLIISLLQKKFSKQVEAAVFLILSGGVSNVFDRIVYGHVVDYITLYVPGQSLAFNIADLLVVSGVLSIFYHEYKRRKKNTSGKPANI